MPGANLPDQVAAYTAHVSNVADSSALYVVMIGGNDVILATLAGLSQPDADAVLTLSVKSEVKQIETLAGDGAKNFLVVNVPDVGLIPLVSGNPSESAAATLDIQFYDSQLNTQQGSLGLPADTALHEFDLYDFNTTILDDATALGFKNTTYHCFRNAPAYASSTTGCSIANVFNFIYWNDVHPSGHVQALWAAGMAAVVPEPSTWVMLAIGFVGTGFAALRRAKGKSGVDYKGLSTSSKAFVAQPRLQPKTASSRFPPVHRVIFKTRSGSIWHVRRAAGNAGFCAHQPVKGMSGDAPLR